MNCLDEWEREQEVKRDEMHFQQQVIAASMGPFDPLLYWRLFDPENMPIAHAADDDWVEFPTDEAGFERMIQDWEQADRQLAAQGGERSFFD